MEENRKRKQENPSTKSVAETQEDLGCIFFEIRYDIEVKI